jgi:hypothetical protein
MKNDSYLLIDVDVSVTVRLFVGNTGLVLRSSDRDKDHFGSRPNSARAGTVKRSGYDRSSITCAKRGDIPCVRRVDMHRHLCLDNIRDRPFIVNCASKWDLDEQITYRSANRYKVLMDSPRGPLLIEFSNALCAHFIVSKAYPETWYLSIYRSYLSLDHWTELYIYTVSI